MTFDALRTGAVCAGAVRRGNPDTEKRRAGLKGAPLVILDEYNQDEIGRSFYLEPEPPLGYFSRAFFLPLLQEFIRRRSEVQAVHRQG